jgi:hypothetical protein
VNIEIAGPGSFGHAETEDVSQVMYGSCPKNGGYLRGTASHNKFYCEYSSTTCWTRPRSEGSARANVFFKVLQEAEIAANQGLCNKESMVI